MTYTNEHVRKLSLGAAREELFNEIVASPYEVPTPGHRRVVRIALSGLAAASVLAVGVSVVAQRGGSQAPVAAPTSEKSTDQSPAPGTGLPKPTAGSVETATKVGSFPIALVAKARQMPRLWVDRAAWTVTSLEGFGSDDGQLVVTGPATDPGRVSLMWMPKKQYPYQDRVNKWREPAPEAGSPYEAQTTFLGEDVSYFALDSSTFVTTVNPAGASIIEIRAFGFDRAAFLELLGDVVALSPEEFLAQMPDYVVKPKDGDATAQAMLEGIPVPAGFEFKPTDNALDRYQFGAEVTSQVVCAWVAHFQSGKPGAQREAGEALMTSRSWPILLEMSAEGHLPQAIWEYAEVVNSGSLAGNTMDQGSFGCPGGE